MANKENVVLFTKPSLEISRKSVFRFKLTLDIDDGQRIEDPWLLSVFDLLSCQLVQVRSRTVLFSGEIVRVADHVICVRHACIVSVHAHRHGSAKLIDTLLPLLEAFFFKLGEARILSIDDALQLVDGTFASALFLPAFFGLTSFWGLAAWRSFTAVKLRAVVG